jgi:hypothetical protein
MDLQMRRELDVESRGAYYQVKLVLGAINCAEAALREAREVVAVEGYVWDCLGVYQYRTREGGKEAGIRGF